MISLHTSPLDQPGTGDAGGMNVYVIELSRRLAARASRSTSSPAPRRRRCRRSSRSRPTASLVRHIARRPVRGADQGRAARPAVRLRPRGAARRGGPARSGHYDVVHSHYWLSGQVGALARDRWGVPLVHSMHTMAKVKNDALAEGDTPEPVARVIGEEQVVEAADMLVANTDLEAKQLINLYDADPARVEVVHPGVDLDVFRPRDQAEARATLGPARGRGRADVRRPDPAAQGPRRAAARGRGAARPGPVAALAARRPRRRRTVRQRPRAPRVARPAGRPSSASTTWCGSCRRWPRRSWPAGAPRRPRSPCRPTTSPSAWSPSRRRRPAPRSWPPRSAG